MQCTRSGDLSLRPGSPRTESTPPLLDPHSKYIEQGRKLKDPDLPEIGGLDYFHIGFSIITDLGQKIIVLVNYLE